MDDQGWMKIHFQQLDPEDDLILWSLPIPLVLCSLPSLQDSRPRESATSCREVSSSRHLASAVPLVWMPFGGMVGLFLF